MAATVSKCEHDDYARHGAEPDVGIALPYFECNDCGEYTMDLWTRRATTRRARRGVPPHPGLGGPRRGRVSMRSSPLVADATGGL